MSSEEKEKSAGGPRQRPVPPAGGAGGARSGWIAIAAVAAVFLAMQFMDRRREPVRDVYSETELRGLVAADEVKSLVRVRRMESGSTWIDGERRDGKIFRVNLVPGENESLMEFLTAQGVKCPVREEEPALSPFMQQLLIFGVFAALLWVFFYRKILGGAGGPLSFGKSKARLLNEDKGKKRITFADVAGVDEAKEDVQEIVEFLKEPSKFTKLGGRIPKGVLLVGPPGTGKTLLAKAIAGEAKVPFFSISGSDFEEMFVGVGASRVRDLFKQAKEAAPSIIFIDEIDAVGRQRGAGLGGGHDEREQTLNQLLVEMDGFDSNEAVVLIAATNRSDILDPALLRPGRFDRQIVVDVPDVKGREKILQVHAANKPLAQDVDLAAIAKLTPGFTGADLSNLLNESALLTARRGKKVISMQEVTESMERVIAGPERKGRVINDKTKRTIAYHESGHALVGHTLPLADPVSKISIVSRGRALGYTLSIPEEDKVLSGREEMMQELAVFLAGRVAEEIFCDDITTGASNDLERATKMARQMVTNYGMSTELGTQVFGEPNHEVFLGRDYGNTQDYSEETARRIDAEVARIMKQAHDTAYEILNARKAQMDQMAAVLLERETVDGEACQALLNNKWDEYRAWEQSDEGKRALEEAASTVANQPEPAQQPAAPEPDSDTEGPSGDAFVELPEPVAPVLPASSPKRNNRPMGRHAAPSSQHAQPQQAPPARRGENHQPRPAGQRQPSRPGQARPQAGQMPGRQGDAQPPRVGHPRSQQRAPLAPSRPVPANDDQPTSPNPPIRIPDASDSGSTEGRATRPSQVDPAQAPRDVRPSDDE